MKRKQTNTNTLILAALGGLVVYCLYKKKQKASRKRRMKKNCLFRLRKAHHAISVRPKKSAEGTSLTYRLIGVPYFFVSRLRSSLYDALVRVWA